MAALVERIVGLEPGVENAPPDVLAAIRTAIAKRPPALQRQLKLFLAILRFLPVARYGAPFERLRTNQQIAMLTWFQCAPVSLLRKGFWGLKALIFMGYYGRPEIGPDLGYRPAANGNDLLRA